MFTLMMMMSLFYFMMSMYLINMNMFILIKYSFIKFLSIIMSIDMMMDWMSILFLSTIMFISSLIILFSKYYIPNNEQKLFLLLLLMFVLSMKILIISNNMFLILLGWDGLGLSSYILVIYYQNFSSAASGTITLLSNRIGDILILLSMAMMIFMSNWSFSMNLEYSTIMMILLMIAACTKSAQLPFSAWLPMAMAAPTPISALVHSSTLVTAGVFILLRIMSNIHPLSMMILLIISSLTTIYSSMSANWEQDMKKIIALSTLSQIAMMMFAISMNLMMLAYMHLIIHALFKSAMFLCAGIMIHESSYQDMRMMGMMFMKSPLTLSILGINSMSLMGIPFMSGFFSKDLIIESMISSKTNMMMLMLMIMSIGMTASYSMRMSFSSSKNMLKSSKLNSNHQSNNSLFPIMILSLLAITSGSWMTWLLSPTQMFIISYNNKINILMLLLLGTMIGFTLQFKNNLYMKMGMSSISLWFTHYLSIIMTKYTFPMMQMFQNNDKNWQEKYGPQLIYNLISKNSSMTEKIKSYLMMIIIMITLIPIFIM